MLCCLRLFFAFQLGMLETQLRFMQQDNEMLRGQLNGGMIEERRERIEIGEEIRVDGHESQLITVLQVCIY